MTRALLTDLATFLWRPVHAQRRPLPLWRAAWWTVRAWSIAFVISIGLSLVVGILLTLAGQSTDDNAVAQFITEVPPWLVVALGVFLLPFLEEVEFRLWLKYARWSLAIGLGVLATALGTLAPWPVPTGFEAAPALALGLLTGLTVWVVAGRLGAARLTAWFDRRFVWLFYGAAAAFAALHLTNFVRLGEIWFLAPVLVAPQFVLGLLLGYLRTRLGFGWAVAAHALHNGVAMLPVLLLAGLSEDTLAALERLEFDRLGRLPVGEYALFVGVSLAAAALALALFLNAVHVVWEAVTAFPQRRWHAVIAPALNCLLPGLGQLYNHEAAKGRRLIALALGAWGLSAAALSLPHAYTSAGAGLLAVALGGLPWAGVWAFALVDGWLVGREIDQAAPPG